ncbi:MAG: MFS transporter [Burkholderiales bacterium]|nr:MFS transporter [Burkholderiales bacterium]
MTVRQLPAGRVIAWMCIAHVVSLAGFSTYPALLPSLQTEWAMSGAEAGLLSGLFFAGYMVAVPVLTSLTDRIDARRVYFASTLAAAAGSAGFALLAQGPASGGAFQLLVGTGVAGTYMPGLRALTDNTAGGAQTRGIAFYTAIFGVGMAGSVLLAGEIAAVAGWRAAFAAAALGPLLAGAIVVIRLPPRTPERSTAPAKLLDFRPVLRNRAAMAFALGYAVHCWELFGTRSWLVAFLASAESAGGRAWPLGPIAITAIANTISPLASILGNELAMRTGRAGVIRAAMTASGLLTCGLGFLVGLPWYGLFLFVVLHMILIMTDSSALTAGLVQAAEPAIRGSAMALHSTLGFGAGFIAPLAFGAALDATGGGGGPVGWGAAYITLGVGGVLAPLVLRWGPRA